MRYKDHVLKEKPAAKVVVRTRWPDQEPKHMSVRVRGQFLDINEPDQQTGWGGSQQLAAAAWRSAYYALVRQKSLRLKTKKAMTRLSEIETRVSLPAV